MKHITIDPKNITNYHRSDYDLELFWLFCLFVAGKNADTASKKLTMLLHEMSDTDTPFSYLSKVSVYDKLVEIKSGQYHRLSRAITESLQLDLRNATVEHLTNIHGVGPKSARFFLLHTRPNCDYAVLDTHILRWIRNNSSYNNVPKSTPQSSNEYHKWSHIAISLMNQKYPNKNLADIDLLIWTEMSGRL